MNYFEFLGGAPLPRSGKASSRAQEFHHKVIHNLADRCFGLIFCEDVEVIIINEFATMPCTSRQFKDAW